MKFFQSAFSALARRVTNLANEGHWRRLRWSLWYWFALAVSVVHPGRFLGQGMRGTFTLAHRWAGLTIAGFLFIRAI